MGSGILPKKQKDLIPELPMVDLFTIEHFHQFCFLDDTTLIQNVRNDIPISFHIISVLLHPGTQSIMLILEDIELPQ